MSLTIDDRIAPLDETEDPGPLDLEANPQYEMLRGLIESGGRPYIKIEVDDVEGGQLRLSSLGFFPEKVPGVLREAADLVAYRLAHNSNQITVGTAS